MPLITFIIPVRHPENASDWSELTRKLSQTVRSIANQTHPDWRVIIVANAGAELPDLPEKFSVIRVTFPPNKLYDLETAPIESVWDAVRLDKGQRILAGMLSARDSRYFMVVDDDDLVSSRLVAHVSGHPDSNGWIIRKGYLWNDGGTCLMGVNNFNDRCGTSLIIRSDLYDFPDSQETADIDWIKTMLGSHRKIDKILSERGHPLETLPFRGSIYRVASSGSHSRTPGILRQIIYPRSNFMYPHRILLSLARLRRLNASMTSEFFAKQPH